MISFLSAPPPTQAPLLPWRLGSARIQNEHKQRWGQLPGVQIPTGVGYREKQKTKQKKRLAKWIS